MVQFEKQLERQLVPEWRFKYCNYDALKKELKLLQKEVDTMRERAQIEKSDSVTRSAVELQSLQKNPGFLQRLASIKNLDTFRISVNVTESEDGVNIYKTRMLPCLTRSGAERVAAAEAVFFGRVDHQMNKIEAFYIDQERQCTQRANSLYRQLEALLEMKKALTVQEQTSAQCLQEEGALEEVKVQEEQEVRVKQFVRTVSTKYSSRRVEEEEEEEEDGEEEEDEEEEEGEESREEERPASSFARSSYRLPSTREVDEFTAPSLSDEEEGAEKDHHSAADLELRHAEEGVKKEEMFGVGVSEQSLLVPKKVHCNITVVTPADSIMRLSRVLWEDGNRKAAGDGEGVSQLSISRTKVAQAEKMLRGAFTEFYKGASMLQSYSAMNAIAIAKILKKHDKIAGWSASQVYLPVLESAQFHTPEKVTAMMSSTETLFLRHFGDPKDQKDGLQSLRPTHKPSSHNTTFFLGLSLGLSLALMVGFAALLVTEGGFTQAGGDSYLASVFPIWAALALLLLHLYLYGLNIWAWGKYRVNYVFIFEFGPGTGLIHRQVFLMCGWLNCVLVGGMVLHLLLRAKTFYEHQVSEWVPFCTAMVYLLLLVNPCRVMYRPARYAFLRSLLHCLMAPWYKVYLADFFLGDQLTSQVPFLRYLEYMVCYYGGGYFLTRDSSFCNDSRAMKDFAFVIAMLPYCMRLMQCLRRYIDERGKEHLYNAAKYLSAMTTVALKVAYSQNHSRLWLALFVTSALGTAIYSNFWDLVNDWGLLRRRASAPWLRNNRVLTSTWVYYVAMVMNVVLRFAWLQSITGVQLGKLDSNVTDFVFAAMEVVRRGQWSFFRLENEHVNNVGKFRAVKLVPLPFRDSEGEEL